MKTKHFAAVALAGVLALGLGACGNQAVSGTNQSSSGQESVSVRQSTDKYTRYVNNYVGMNLANFGRYASLYHEFWDESYSPIPIVYLNVQSDDGSYVDISSVDARKGWYVVSQEPAPNTEIKIEYTKNSDGEEVYDSATVKAVNLKVAKAPSS